MSPNRTLFPIDERGDALLRSVDCVLLWEEATNELAVDGLALEVLEEDMCHLTIPALKRGLSVELDVIYHLTVIRCILRYLTHIYRLHVAVKQLLANSNEPS